MNTLHLKIPNMKSTHCQITVSNILNSLGAQVKSLAPAQVVIELTNGVTQETVVRAIESVGYKVTND